MDSQVKQLKLNVTNIKSYLISSNKELRKLRIQKKELFFKLEKKKELKAEESRIESKNLGIGAGFSRLMSVVTAPVRSIFDRILDFFGLIALGILVQKLPDMIAKIEEFFNSDFIKTVGSVFTTIGTGFQKLGELIDLLTPQKQKEIDQDLKAIEKESDDGLKMADQSDKDVSELEKELNKREKDNNGSTPPAAPPGPRTPSSSTTQQSPTPTPTQTNPSPASPRSTPPNSPIQKLSRGGTVQPSNSPQTKAPYQPRKSAQLERAQKGMGNGFEDFSLAVENINQTIQRDEKNVMAFAELSKNFREWSSLSEKSTTGKPPGQTPGADMGFPSSSSGADSGLDLPIDPGNQIVGYVGSSGRSSGPHIHIETGNGVTGSGGEVPQSVLSNIIVGGKPLSSWTLGDGIGSGRNHRGFDYSGAGIDGKPIQLKGGLKFINYDTKLDPGGYGNNILIQDKNGNKYLIAHLSAGPEKPEEFKRRKEKAKKITKQQIISPSRPGADPQLKGAVLSPADPVADGIKGLSGALQRKPGGGGGNRNLLNNTSSSGNRSLFIYAVQPVETFVPFPYPVPTQQTSSSPPQRQRLPEIWRQ